MRKISHVNLDILCEFAAPLYQKNGKNFAIKVLKGERERNSAMTLESMIKEVLQEVHDDQQNECDNVNLALEKRIEETEKAKKKLEDHLSRVTITKRLTIFSKYILIKIPCLN